MAIQLRTYTDQPGYTDDFHRVCEFLVRVSQGAAKQFGMLWVRWEWSVARGLQDGRTYERIGIWEDGGRIVGVALGEDRPGQAWLIVDPAYADLRPEMIRYARARLRHDSALQLSIDDTDRAFQRYAAQQGFRPTQAREQSSALALTEAALSYTLPDGYRVVGFDELFDMRRYNEVMWRGFDHAGPPPDDDASLEWRRNCVTSPHATRSLLTAVVAPDGSFVSHCGMWRWPGADYAVVEPVATHPGYRRRGLARAAVLEAARRCAQLGASAAIVGSSQQFYYDIGFAPCSNETFWAG